MYFNIRKYLYIYNIIILLRLEELESSSAGTGFQKTTAASIH